MHVTDLKGNEYMLQATSSNEGEVNSNQTFSATIYATKVNKAFITDIQEMWTVTDLDDIEHKIVYCKRQGQGCNMTVEIKAIPLFFDYMDNSRIYEEYDEHMTAISAFTRIFDDVPFDFVLVDVFDAVQWEGFGGGESRLETFKRALERYKCEYRISGNVIYLERQVGRDTQFMYRHKLNASNIVQEIDADEMWTYAKGYGDYGNEGAGEGEEGSNDWQDAKLTRDYTSPLADIIGIRHAPPLKDGRVTDKKTMDNQLKTLVNESLKISVSADIHDLRKQGYPVAQAELGDRVFLIDERIGLKEEIRVVSQSITRDWKGKVINLNITFGSDGLTKRHQSGMQTATDNINEIIAGRKKLPFSVLPGAKQAAIKALESAQTELIFGDGGNGVQGIIAQDKDDPNKLVWLNSAGWMISTDGGATTHVAATADGIVANAITTGVLNTDSVVVRGGDGKSYAVMTGDEMETRGTHTRTWFGETETHDVGMQLKYGRMRYHNYDNGRNLYISEKGIGTYIGGSNDEDEGYYGSGVIEFFSHMFDNDIRGLTLYSNRGTIGLLADTRDVVLDADRSVDIRSRRQYVNIKPQMDSRPGYNHFRFGIKDNDSASENDGFITFGSSNSGHASGIRFKKSKTGQPTVWATNGAGDKAEGSFYGKRLYGDLYPRGSYAYAIADGFRVMTSANKNKYGSVRAAKYYLADGSLVPKAFSSLSLPPKKGEGTELVNNLKLDRRTDDHKPIYTPNGHELAMEELIGSLIKNNQELNESVENIKEDINATKTDRFQQSDRVPIKAGAGKKCTARLPRGFDSRDI